MIGKQLWVLAGDNSVGKTTFYNRFLKDHGLPLVDPEVVYQNLFPENRMVGRYHAARYADEIRNDLAQQGISFCLETVLSHASRVDFLAHAKSMGYEIILVVISLETMDLLRARTNQKLEQGGLVVTEEQILNRMPRTRENLKRSMPLSDRVYLLDNSSCEKQHKPLAQVRNGQIQILSKSPLASSLISDLLE